jgi:hypothetical protein
MQIDHESILKMPRSEFNSKIGELIEATLQRLLAAMNDPEKIEKASLNNIAYAHRQLMEQQKALESKPTRNHESPSTGFVRVNLQRPPEHEQV